MFSQPEERAATTIKKLAAAYLEKHARLKKKTWRHDESLLRRLLLPKLGSWRVTAVSTAEIQAIHAAKGIQAPGEANNFVCVVRITPLGVETVLYSFGSSSADGQGPSGALVQASDGNFYGTTASGGSTASSGSANSNCASANVNSRYSGCGTIYKITPTGIATVLYSFGSTPEDGTVPTGALLQARDGNLYGTTTTGGAANEGIVFKLVLGAN